MMKIENLTINKNDEGLRLIIQLDVDEDKDNISADELIDAQKKEKSVYISFSKETKKESSLGFVNKEEKNENG